MDRCRKCKYYEQIEKDGFCYRYPPQVVVIRGQIQSEYPPVDKNADWCGEFEQKIETTIEVVEAD